MVRAGCKATIAANYKGERTRRRLERRPRAHRRVARRRDGPERLGVLHRPRRLPHRRAARPHDRRGPTPRILDFANRNVGIGCGNVHIWDPEADNGTVNSGVTLAGLLPVYGDRGGGAEINGKIEAGLLGVTVAPDFAQTGHIYLQYFPTFNPDNPVHPGLADGDQRRITKMAEPRISRFTVDLADQAARPRLRGRDLRVRVPDLQLLPPRRRHGLRLRGQPLRHDRRLELVAEHERLLGQLPARALPHRRPDRGVQRPLRQQPDLLQRRAPHRRKHQRLQRQDAALQPDRHDPRRVAAAIGVGTTYSLPTADLAQRPEPLQRHRGQRQQDEAGDLRDGPAQPVAPVHRSRDRHPVLGVGRPRRRVAVRDPGPVDVRERHAARAGRQLRVALLHGQPAGVPRPHRRRLAAHDERRRLRQRRPGRQPDAGLVRLQGPRQRLDEQHRPHRAPAPDGYGKDAGTARPTNLWYSRGNPGGANGCPTFQRELGPDAAPNYGGTPTQLCPYLTASGATIFNGPVYRYDDDATDNSARWPEYWDGRWFLQDFSNNSAKHGLLLDPATDQDGGQPVYADSLRGVLNWQNNYMDSKFGPDGALYVQVYDGFFTTGAGAGLYRFAYTGGPDTPNPDPQWTTTGTPGRSSSPSAAPAASPTNGTSATAARPRPSRAPATRTPRRARSRSS